MTPKVFRSLSIMVYIVSLFLPVFYACENCGAELIGIGALILGVLQLFCGGVGLSWFANVFLWFSWADISNPRRSFLFSIAAVAFAAMVLCFHVVKDGNTGPTGTDYTMYTSDMSIYAYGSGYYVWLLSTCIMPVGHLYQFIIRFISLRSG